MRVVPWIAAGLVAAGCSGGDERLSREEFAERADDICRRNRSEVEAQPTSFARFPHYAARVGPLVKKNVAEISELKPPADDEDRVDTLLAGMRAKVEAFDRLREAVAADDEAAQRDAIDAGVKANEDAKRAARELGLQVCGTA